MTQTSSIKAHFDGHSVVLDEPASLAVGQQVTVIAVTPTPSAGAETTALGPGGWKGRVQILNECDDIVLEHFKDTCLEAAAHGDA